MSLNSNKPNIKPNSHLSGTSLHTIVKRSSSINNVLLKNREVLPRKDISEKFINTLKTNYVTALERDVKVGTYKRFLKSTDQRYLGLLNSSFMPQYSGVYRQNKKELDSRFEKKHSIPISELSKETPFPQKTIQIKDMNLNKKATRSRFSILQNQKSKLQAVKFLAQYKKGRESKEQSKMYGLLLSTLPAMNKKKIQNEINIKPTKTLMRKTLKQKVNRSEKVKQEELINPHPYNFCDYEYIKNTNVSEVPLSELTPLRSLLNADISRKNSTLLFIDNNNEEDESSTIKRSIERRLTPSGKIRKTVLKTKHKERKHSILRASFSNQKIDYNDEHKSSIDNSRFALIHLNKSLHRQRKTLRTNTGSSNINRSRNGEEKRKSTKPPISLFEKPDTSSIWMKMINRLLNQDTLHNNIQVGYYHYYKLDSESVNEFETDIANNLHYLIEKDIFMPIDDCEQDKKAPSHKNI